MRVAVLNTHPIQYFAPLYRFLSAEPAIDLTVVFASTQGLTEALDPGFGRAVAWDVPLLDGYRHTFLRGAEKNRKCQGRHHDVSDLEDVLLCIDPDVVVVHGYVDAIARAGLRWRKLNPRLRVALRGDTWSGRGEKMQGLAARAKRTYLKRAVQPYVDGFFAVGRRNAEYWREIGAPESKIFLVRYGIDSVRFNAAAADERQEIRNELGFRADERVVGFFGKLVSKKGIDRLVLEMKRAGTLPFRLLIVGDGPLRNDISQALQEMSPRPVMTGFVNQSRIAGFYAAVDIVVVPSLKEETWGFVVQEALACGTPVIASDAVGCAPDLIRPGRNGWIVDGTWRSWIDILNLWATGDATLHRSDEPEIPDFVDSAKDFGRALRAMAADR